MRVLLTKAILISILAGSLAALPFAILFSLEMDASLRLTVFLNYLAIGIGGALLIGLPTSLLVFHFTKEDAGFGLSKVLLVSNGIAITIVFALGGMAGWFGAIFFGIPTVLAANVFATTGWILILRPYRRAMNA